jgi:hypothetical protein
MMSE